MPSLIEYLLLWEFLSGGGIDPLGSPQELRFAHARAVSGGNLSLNWAWDPPGSIGPGATSVSYESEVQEVTSGGDVVVSWRSQAPHDSSDLDREIRVPISGNFWQIRVRCVNDATPVVRSEWVVSEPHPAALPPPRYFSDEFDRRFS